MKERIAFVHIPKTAGSFFTAILRENYSKDEIYPKFFIEDFESFYTNSPLKYSLYHGHMGFAHTKNLNAKTITFLRDPIDRLVSLYFYFKELFEHEKDNLLYKLAINNVLTEFVETKEDGIIIHCYNSQLWHLAFDPTIKTRNKISSTISEDDLYRLAIENLNSCSFVGITELMDSSLDFFYKLFPKYIVVKDKFSSQKINITKKRPKINDIPIADRRILMKYCEIDYAVYDYAIRIFNTQLQKLKSD